MAYIIETQDGKVKDYIIKGQNNPCGCGSNVFYRANMTKARKTLGVCNACNETIYEYKEYQEFEGYEFK